jgi:hypothetical protein
MGKLLGFGKGQQGNTLRLNYKNYVAEIGVQNGKFVFYVNNEVVHNLGTMQDQIDTLETSVVTFASLAAPAASPTFTGVTKLAAASYADKAAADADAALLAGSVYKITATGVLAVKL